LFEKEAVFFDVVLLTGPATSRQNITGI